MVTAARLHGKVVSSPRAGLPFPHGPVTLLGVKQTIFFKDG